MLFVAHEIVHFHLPVRQRKIWKLPVYFTKFSQKWSSEQGARLSSQQLAEDSCTLSHIAAKQHFEMCMN